VSVLVAVAGSIVSSTADAGARDASLAGTELIERTGDVDLMRPGLWLISASMKMAGNSTANTSQQCITPEKVREIASGNVQGLLQMQAGGCQIQQSVQGRELVGNGTCAMGSMAMYMSVRISFDTASHLSGQISESFAGQPAPAIFARIEGHRIGVCGG